MTETRMPTSSVEIDGVAFAYDDRVLTPRPWTLAQAEWGRDLLGRLPAGPVLELCSGVGHIGLLTVRDVDRGLVMVDASLAACDLARANAETMGLGGRVEIRPALLEEALAEDERFALIIADPPWVPSSSVETYPEDPAEAIDGGPDGLGPARACLALAAQHLADDGVCLLQVGSTAQAVEVSMWLTDCGALHVAETRVFERGVLVLVERV